MSQSNPENEFDLRPFPWAPLLFAGVLVASALVVNEWTAARYVSADGALSGKVRLAFGVVDAVALAGAGLCVFARRQVLRMLGGTGRRANAVACVVTFVLFLVTFLLFEVGVYAMARMGDESSPYTRERSPGLMTDDALLGRRAEANGEFHEYFAKGDTTVFDATYTYDAYRRRVTLGNPAGADRFVMVMGGSFAMGTGVGDDETMAAQLAVRTEDTVVYNYGQPGDGPHHALAILNEWDLQTQIPERAGHCVYVFIPQHIPRAIGTMRHAAVQGWNEPAFGENGKYLGSYAEAYPVRMLFYRVLAREQVLRYLSLDVPPAVLDTHIEFTAKLLKAAETRFAELFDSRGFHVLLHPLYEDSGVQIARVRRILEAQEIDVLDYYDITLPGPREDWFFEGDMHPRAVLHGLIAGQVAAALRF